MFARARVRVVGRCLSSIALTLVLAGVVLPSTASAQSPLTVVGPLRDLADQYTRGEPTGEEFELCFDTPQQPGWIALEEVGVGYLWDMFPIPPSRAMARDTSAHDAASVCPDDVVLSYAGGIHLTTLAEGAHTFRGISGEPGAHDLESETWTVYIDRTGPDMLLGGRLRNARHSGLYSAEPATLTVSAFDGNVDNPRSGVASLEVFVTPPGGAEQRVKLDINSCTDARNCAQTTTYEFRPADWAHGDGTYGFRVRAVDKLGNESQEAWSVRVDKQGRIYHVFSYEGDPAGDYDRLSNEYVRLVDRSARRLNDTLDGYFTQTLVDCAGNDEGCLESRAYDSVENFHATVVGSGPTDERVLVSEAMSAVIDVGTAPIATGPIGDAVDAWQSLPPGHGTQYELHETTEDTTVDGVSATLRQRVWIDAATRLPLKIRTLQDTDLLEQSFFSYSSTVQTTSQVAPDFFRPAAPAGAESETTTLPLEASQLLSAPPEPSREQRIETATNFRRDLGFDASLATVENLVDNPPLNDSVGRYGVPMTNTELDALADKLAIQQARPVIEAYAESYPDTYGGSYIDHANGSLIHVAFTEDADERIQDLEELFDYPELLRARTVEHSLQDLKELKDDLLQDVKAGGIPFEVTSLSTDVLTNRVIVGSPEATAANATALTASYGDSVTLEEAFESLAASVTKVRAGYPISAGRFPMNHPNPLTRGEPGRPCTLGFGGYRRAGVGNRYYYQLTAGHCLPNRHRGWLANYYQPVTMFGDRIARVQGNAYPYGAPAEDPTPRNADVAAIYLFPQAGRSSLIRVEPRVDTERSYSVRGKAVARAGDFVCLSGWRTRLQSCGQVRNDDHVLRENEGDIESDWGGPDVTTYIGPLLTVNLTEDCGVRGGDSGGPVYNYVINGVQAVGLIEGVDQDPDCGGEDPDAPGFPHPDAGGGTAYVTPIDLALEVDAPDKPNKPQPPLNLTLTTRGS